MNDLQGAQWRKSTFSSDSGECVEVASTTTGVRGVRDSTGGGAALACPDDEWSVFVTGVKWGDI
ncbi:hypothetical protein Sru01_00320 [Sphaerisporangium rufum]|uniref:DUF397 domain-containing protein n=1 Tax=Sphaerisporangium rufum TaxID=1381558 RepID=A0A919R110_9ACTN|nr:DUF397 domain-containing protein [Sphaerisporangium rufum]GII75050.1 hypothetical protein Sru01_00320 [Sphaerisporangium rufum]